MYKRAEYQIIKNRLEEPRKLIQVVMGARQIGKSTVVKQVLKDLDLPHLFYSADNVGKEYDLIKFPINQDHSFDFAKSSYFIFTLSPLVLMKYPSPSFFTLATPFLSKVTSSSNLQGTTISP